MFKIQSVIIMVEKRSSAYLYFRFCPCNNISSGIGNKREMTNLLYHYFDNSMAINNIRLGSFSDNTLTVEQLILLIM